MSTLEPRGYHFAPRHVQYATHSDDAHREPSAPTRHISNLGRGPMTGKKILPLFLAFLFAVIFTPALRAQDWVRTGTNLGVQRIRLAAASFKPMTTDVQTLP